jgi:hypothetical protein
LEVGSREVGIEERSIGINLRYNGSSKMQVPEARISKGPYGRRKPFRPAGDFQARNESHYHPTLHRVPG